MAKLYVFDLDGTIIDTSHRLKHLPDGTVDIAHWRANSTPSMVARDKELPLADYMRHVSSKGKPVVICTARVLKTADYEWLIKHRLHADLILSRNGEGDTRSPAVQKVEQLRRFALLGPRVNFYDDSAQVCEAVRSAHRFLTIHVTH